MNQDRNIVIIGCGAGGGTAAQFARKTDRKSTITIFEKDRYPQYSKCGLPYAISGQIPKFKDLIEFSEDWFKKERIDLLLETRVDKIDVKKQIVIAKKGNTSIEKSYSRLIITAGAQPIIPPIKNIQKNGRIINEVHTLRTIDDGKKIALGLKKGKKATIVGVGLIGLEIADSFYKKGIDVTKVEALPNILENTLDNDMCEPVLKELHEKIKLYTNHIATKVEEKNGTIDCVFIKDNKTNEEKKWNLESDELKNIIDIAIDEKLFDKSLFRS